MLRWFVATAVLFRGQCNYKRTGNYNPKQGFLHNPERYIIWLDQTMSIKVTSVYPFPGPKRWEDIV